MTIIEYFAQNEAEQARWRAAIGKGEWRAAAYLAQRLAGNRLRREYGARTRLLLGVEDGELAAFCTLAEQDEIDAPDMTPWIGFVYVFPEYRGRRRSGEMIDHACALAKRDGFAYVYLSTNEIGLYEKYGFKFLCTAEEIRGGEARVYARKL